MKPKANVLIIGNGRIARAVFYYYKNNPRVNKVGYLTSDSQARYADLLVGALAGELGPKCLQLALKYRKNLIDISDVDPPYYLANQKAIAKAGITVIPGCGFSPGIVNAILGRQCRQLEAIREIEVKAGSLSAKKSFYPFLWCFEDIVLEHRIASWQVIGGKKKKFPAFSGYQKERYCRINAESYYVASGFENVFDKIHPVKLTVRVIRPEGFKQFFGFLESHGCLNKTNLPITKKLLEEKKEDNITLAQITIKTKGKKDYWYLQARSSKSEMLNSMQKITASVPAVMGMILLEDALGKRGLLFMEDLACDDKFFSRLIQGVKEQGVIIRHA